MSYDYNKLYGENPNALGNPTKIFVDFFDRYDKPHARILDVGCGQGRDALFIARQGHKVVGVDLSANGVRDLVSAARREGLAIEGVVADIRTYRPNGQFDVILLDRTLHMLPTPDRLAVLKVLLDHVGKGGWVLIADETTNIAGFEAVIEGHCTLWRTDLRKRGYLFVQRE